MPTARRFALSLSIVSLTTACDESRQEPRASTPADLFDALDDATDDDDGPAPVLGLDDAATIDGRYVVVLDKGATADDLDDVLGASAQGASTWLADASIHHVYRSAFMGFAADLDDAEVDALRVDPRVAYIEADREVTATGVTWGLDRIDQDDLPLDGIYDPGGLDGTGVHAYIVDTGIRSTHVLLAGRVGEGYSVVGEGVEDCNGHGTHVAGTVGGVQYGVAPGVTLHPVRVLGCDGKGTMSGIAAGLDWVRGHLQGPSVVNMSLGGPGSSVTDYAVSRLRDAGVTVVVAAGNEDADACGHSPARSGDAITVGATRYTDDRWSLSNFGACVDIFAPGSAITSASNAGDTYLATMSGTSMASPHVAGVVALYLQAHPDASPAQVREDVLAVAVEGKVIDPHGSPNLLLSAHVPVADPDPQPDPEPDPEPEPGTCDGCTDHAGTLADQATQWQPDGTYFQIEQAMTLVGILSGPADADFDLALYRWTGEWTRVVASESATANESIQHPADPGYYVWKIWSYKGAGDYVLSMN